MGTHTVTVWKLKTTLLLKTSNCTNSQSPLYKYSTVEFIIIECMLNKIRQKRKIFIFLRIALAKVTKLNHKCLQHLTAVLISVFPWNQKPGPKGFCIPPIPWSAYMTASDGLRSVYCSIITSPSAPFSLPVAPKKPQSRLPGSLGNKPPPQILCTWHWPRQHVASVASKRCHTSAGQTRPQDFCKGWCSEAFQT